MARGREAWPQPPEAQHWLWGALLPARESHETKVWGPWHLDDSFQHVPPLVTGFAIGSAL